MYKTSEESEKWSRGSLEAVKECPACGSKNHTRDKYKRHCEIGTMPDLWRFSRCNDCRSIFLNPRPDASSLPLAYSDYYTHQNDDETIPDKGVSNILWRLIHGYLNRRFQINRQPAINAGYFLFSLLKPLKLKLDYYGRHLFLVKEKGSLLDIGCGNGSFLLRAREMGWHIMGCEPAPTAAKECINKKIEITDDAFSLCLDNRKFDVITMGHVIEHVADSRSVLRRAHELLNAGGMLWLAYPNPESISLGVFSSAWQPLHPPFHICIISQKQIKKC